MTQTPVPQQDGNKAANSNNNRLRMNVQMGVILAVVLALVAGFAISAQDKYSAKVPGGLAMSESGDTKIGRPFPSAGTKESSRSFLAIPR